MSEKGELKSEVTPFFGGEMSCVIPPFSAKFRMSCMVGRKAVDISWQRPPEGVFILLAMDDCSNIKS